MGEIDHIVIIDDSEDDRMMYRRAVIKSIGTDCKVEEADNGDAGLELIGRHAPGCVLLDYSLPGRNGMEVLKQIRSKHPFLPVVMLTGQGNEGLAVTAMQEGAQNYISKNRITAETLQQAVRGATEHCALQSHIHEQREALAIFTRALAHDLKEPVRTIRSFLELLVREQTLSEKGQGYFAHIGNAAERMERLIEMVYLYTRFDAHEKIVREPCDMALALMEAQENLSEQIRERTPRITSGNLPVVEASRIQLIQLLQNFISNAMRHGPKGVGIHVSVRKQEGEWRLCVGDDGPGIDERQHEKIFDPFKRLSPDREGSGLGLAICRKIVELHGGRIWCESAPGEGARFLFTLSKTKPGSEVKSPDKRRARLQAAAILGNAAPANVLLVDDNESDLELAPHHAG